MSQSEENSMCKLPYENSDSRSLTPISNGSVQLSMVGILLSFHIVFKMEHFQDIKLKSIRYYFFIHF